ncbi:sigma factor-like helix-turn-helix DNA-binding protein [Acrocarpospora pleiomorpha]|uniref:sigma factor-like helix-turn-helix DNA-binding protein n=1 Tax=Acrocarpospora pleiomorpha TaxID=90975 RepID=UPI0024833B83|nr:sigma factor-like helix-turn-helix DNA-binding protein [Acrocarpospora pleiomorpha]
MLAAVPEERRTAFVLTQVIGLPYHEVAEHLGCPVGTVRSRVARARLQFVASLTQAEQAA